MGTLSSLLLLIVFLSLGFASGRAGLIRQSRALDFFFSGALYLLMLSMGLRLGQSREVLSRLSEIGAIALVGTLGASFGTVVLHLALSPLYRLLSPVHVSKRSAVTGGRLRILVVNMRKPVFLLVLVVAGSVAGIFLPPTEMLRDGSVSTWILYLLLFIIGVQMAMGQQGLRKLLLNPAILLMPAVTIVGTLAGSLVLTRFNGISVGYALAMGSGFGWYSLSGVLIADLGEPVLGAAAFLSNLLRETLAFLLVPALRATGRYENGIGLCGATSMDVTLPVIEDTWGSALVPISVAHGVILSFLVPFLVPLFMSF